MTARGVVVSLTIVVAWSLIAASTGGAYSDTWLTKSPFPTTIIGNVTQSGGTAYVLGGNTQNLGGGGIVGRCWRYNASTDSWTKLSNTVPLPVGYTATVSTSDGRIWLLGGVTDDGVLVGNVQIYDPAANSWADGPPLPQPRQTAAATVDPQGRIWFLGGYDGTKGTSTVWMLDPTAAHPGWVNEPRMLHRHLRFGAAVGSNGTTIYAIDGIRGVEGFSLVTNTWSDDAPLPKRLYAVAVKRGSDGHIYAIGGSNGNDAQMRFTFAYDTAANTWTRMANLPIAIDDAGIAKLADGSILIATGNDSDGDGHPDPVNLVFNYR